MTITRTKAGVELDFGGDGWTGDERKALKWAGFKNVKNASKRWIWAGQEDKLPAQFKAALPAAPPSEPKPAKKAEESPAKPVELVPVDYAWQGNVLVDCDWISDGIVGFAKAALGDKLAELDKPKMGCIPRAPATIQAVVALAAKACADPVGRTVAVQNDGRKFIVAYGGQDRPVVIEEPRLAFVRKYLPGAKMYLGSFEEHPVAFMDEKSAVVGLVAPVTGRLGETVLESLG